MAVQGTVGAERRVSEMWARGHIRGGTGIRVALNHRTEYRYDKAVLLGPQVIQLRPAPHARTPILSYSLTVQPAHHILKWQLDPHHNHLARVLFPERTLSLIHI